MRPRHKAAENDGIDGRGDGVAAASMRPRHKAAENGAIEERAAVLEESFNEAAA